MEIRPEGLDAARVLLGNLPGAIERAAARAINRTTASVKTAAVKKTAEEYYATQREIKGTIGITKATAKRPVAALISRGKRMPLSMFKITPNNVDPKNRTTMRAQVKRSGSGGAIRRAFWVKFASGHTAVVERRGRPRLPIDELYGLAVPQMMSQEVVTAAMSDKTETILSERLDHEVDAILKGYTK